MEDDFNGLHHLTLRVNASPLVQNHTEEAIFQIRLQLNSSPVFFSPIHSLFGKFKQKLLKQLGAGQWKLGKSAAAVRERTTASAYSESRPAF